METQLNATIIHAAGLLIGTGIGLLFGVIQDMARRRFEKRHPERGQLANATMTPGSMTRVAFLLVALAFVQGICPMLFSDSTQWWVSSGVVVGFGWMLFNQLKQRRNQLPS